MVLGVPGVLVLGVLGVRVTKLERGGLHPQTEAPKTGKQAAPRNLIKAQRDLPGPCVWPGAPSRCSALGVAPTILGVAPAILGVAPGAPSGCIVTGPASILRRFGLRGDWPPAEPAPSGAERCETTGRAPNGRTGAHNAIPGHRRRTGASSLPPCPKPSTPPTTIFLGGFRASRTYCQIYHTCHTPLRRAEHLGEAETRSFGVEKPAD